MKSGVFWIAILFTAQVCIANELQQQYEKAYFLETSKGQTKQAIAIYKTISEKEPNKENEVAIKQSLLRLLHIATIHKSESTIKECHEKLLQKTDTTIQKLVDAAKPDSTIYIPEGLYSEPVSIDKNLTLKGANRATCIIEVTADQPLVYAAPKSKVTIESLTLKNQLETSQKTDPPGYTLVAQDATVVARDCLFIALGNIKRSPVSVFARGFSNVQLEECRFEGFEYTIQYGEGTKGLVKDCIIQDSGHCGITAYEDSDVTIQNNVITGSLYHGIRSTGGTIHVRDNLIIDNRNRGIYLGSKPAHGSIINNVIIGNSTGISAFSYTDTKIENNLILNSGYSGIDTRNTCKISVKNNIFSGNSRGFSVQDPQGGNKFKVVRNTFWKNEQTSGDYKLPSTTIEENPQFKDPTTGNFAIENSKVKSAGHGLSNPEPIASLWKQYVELDSAKAEALILSMENMLAADSGRQKGSLQENVNGFDMMNGDLKNALRTFGEPESYIWGNNTFKKNSLPQRYIMTYPDGFRIFMFNDNIVEFRFEEKTVYEIGGLTVGTPLSQVLKILGKPRKTVNNRECDYEERILYKNSKGQRNGHAYYADKGLRLFFMHNKVIALYVTDNTILR